ncbi:MAG: hypothetical protein ABSF22_16730 [Bryobacteraceae bacterium]
MSIGPSGRSPDTRGAAPCAASDIASASPPSRDRRERSLRRPSLLLLLATLTQAAPTLSFHILGNDPGSWPAILSSIGLKNSPSADVLVIPTGAQASLPECQSRLDRGAFIILEGPSPLAESFGFHATTKPHVIVRSVEDVRAPKLHIIWEKPLDLPVFELPKEAQVFAAERWQGVPLMAGLKRAKGAVLWIAASPGKQGYERFPYIPQALADLGLEAPFRSERLWAFFDSAYRSRVDLDYFAARWKAAGIGALHVAAWHYWERDPQGDEYLRQLIEACHRHGIVVYAWLELPHVSEKFWDQHPEWREKTALLQDAQLDWRKLMNLTNRAAFAEVSRGVRDLIGRFDWDGVNLAELYFESLEGIDNPARFTPMNDDVRAEFREKYGFDPIELFGHLRPARASEMAHFVDLRADIARRQQAEWLAQIDAIRKTKPHLDLTLTHVDDRFDTTMREKIGADASKVLPMLSFHDFTFLIEDPATIWNLGPQRYPQIAARYAALTPSQDKLAIDINVVERYQDVYPTKQQTGTELFELVHTASAAFPRVALYFENSILSPDLALLSAAASSVDRAEIVGGKLIVESRRGAGVPWQGPALVDGKPWPILNEKILWLPRGPHSIEPAVTRIPLRILDFNGELKSAKVLSDGVEFAYQSSARALVTLEQKPAKVEIDGAEVKPEFAGNVLILPRGQHLVTLTQ